MGFKDLIDFLGRLQDNNHKTWMDENRKEYKRVRDFYISWLDNMNQRLADIDPYYFDTPGKKAINRINNNLLYHPHLPTYKDHFGAGLDQVTKTGDFYIEIGCNESAVSGGYWKPPGDILRSIRDGIDYNGEVLQAILNDKTFKANFGGLINQDQKLSKIPQGFEKNHPHIELLKNRTFAVQCHLSKQEVCASTFDERILELYEILLPFRRYLNQAVTV